MKSKETIGEISLLGRLEARRRAVLEEDVVLNGFPNPRTPQFIEKITDVNTRILEEKQRRLRLRQKGFSNIVVG